MVHCCVACSQLVSDIAWHVLVILKISDEFIRLGCQKDTSNLVLKMPIKISLLIVACVYAHTHIHIHIAQTCSEMSWKDGNLGLCSSFAVYKLSDLG